MRDGGAERGRLGLLGIHVDELVILGHVGIGVDARLIDQVPGGHADLLADQGLIGLERDRRRLPDLVHLGLTPCFRQLRKILLAEFLAPQRIVAIIVAFEPS